MKAKNTKSIDGAEFEVEQLPAFRALRLLNKLANKVGPGLAQLAGALEGVKSGADLLNADVAKLGAAAGHLMACMSEDDIEAITRELLQGARMNGAELLPQFNIALRGRMLTVMKVLGLALEVNYGDFIGALRGVLPVAAGPSPSQSS